VVLTAPKSAEIVKGVVTLAATASDNQGVVGVRFFIDGIQQGAEDSVAPYEVPWDTSASSNGAHYITVTARDAAGNATTTRKSLARVSNR
jgi:hypothetical protein